MTEIWYRQLGFHNNPLSIKPAVFHDNLEGYKDTIDEISYTILSNKNVFLKGEFGEGKTTILKRLINDFGGKKEVIYFSCNRIDRRINVKRLLNGRYGFWGKIFDLRPRNMILLLDEAQTLEKKDYEKLMNYYNSGFFKSIVFVSQDYEEEHIPENLKQTLKVVTLDKITEEDAINIIKNRVGNLPLLSKKVVKLIFKESDNNIRKLLKNCEEVCKYAINYGEERVTEELVREVLNKKQAEAIIKTEPKEEKLFIKKETPKEEQKEEAIKEEKAIKEEEIEEIKIEKPKKKEAKPTPQKHEETKGIEIIEVREDEIEEEKPKTASVIEDDFDEELEKELASLPPEEAEDDKRRKVVKPRTAEEALSKPAEELLGEEYYY